MVREVVVVGAVPTAIGKRNGALSQSHAAELSGQVLRALGGAIAAGHPLGAAGATLLEPA